MKISSKRKTNITYRNETSTDDNDDYEISVDSIRSCDSLLKTNRITSSPINHKNESTMKKRGRKSSKVPCLNHNALMARKNRQKKKEYLMDIENKLTYYRNENTKLVDILKKQDINLKRLNAEVLYLKNVLKNNTSIIALLDSMNSAINNKNSAKTISSCKNSEMMNDEVAVNTEMNAVTKEWMNHETIPVENENFDVINEKGKDVNMIFNHLNRFISLDHTHALSEHKNGKLFDFKGFENNLQSFGIILSEIDKPIDNESSNELTTAALSTPTSLTSLISSSSPNSYNVDRFNTVTMNEDIPEVLFNDEANSLDDYFKCDSNLLDTNNLLGNLGTSGICLHVNANKISIEFCSICHVNSINSEDS